MKKVIAVFDIGKTNKKILLFDEYLQLAYQNEEKFKTTVDEDGDECDDLPLMEEWMKTTLSTLILGAEYDIKAVNFSTYGASLAFIGNDGQRLTPIYNYLKDINCSIQESLFSKYGGEAEFCRQTASPALGLMLNSGIQILWMKEAHPEIFAKTESIVHFPQYLSYVLTGKVVAESTSIGCHTFLWNFDTNTYNKWLSDEGISLPEPLANTTTIESTVAGQQHPGG
ncbi:MAG: FGGY family carbohydrate kinase [Bacteroidales bacterium]|jgi:sugar (pentulose or hexulose) kinase|nr:FGGY family carbohydrate kinase [Bacteroidales bacterium]